jgi:hypothetical protein
MSSDVYLHASSDSFWTDSPSGAASVEDCQAQCTTGCIMFRYRQDPVQCSLLMELEPESASFSSRAALGFKAYSDGVVHDYAFHYVPNQLTIGNLVEDMGPNITLKDCMDACFHETKCILIRVTGSSMRAAMDSCKLFAYDIDTEFVSVYRVDGRRLFHDGFASAVVTDSWFSTLPGLVAAAQQQVQTAKYAAAAAATASVTVAPAPQRAATSAAASMQAGMPL